MNHFATTSRWSLQGFGWVLLILGGLFAATYAENGALLALAFGLTICASGAVVLIALRMADSPPCTQCNGTGKVPSMTNKPITCPVCKGTGKDPG